MTVITRVYGLKSCDMTRKALKELEKAGVSASFSDLREVPLDAEMRDSVLDALGERAVNRASTTWRALSGTDRARPFADLLADHPTLYKRPLIHVAGKWYCGWGPEVRTALLG